MTKKRFKYIIIGAGVSGLTSAYQLLIKCETDFIILEARNRVGGRVETKNYIDFGPAWFQPNHYNLSSLLQHLNIDKFSQFSKGKSILVYGSSAPAHYFESDQSQPSAKRIEGGSHHLIKKLAHLVSDKIVLNTQIIKLVESENGIEVLAENQYFLAEKVIVTLPPQLALQINYQPQLPSQLQNVMRNTHTWMSSAIKVGITYKTPFWREKQLSGTVIGQNGPVSEIYDHTNADETAFSLMGFVNERLRNLSASDRKEVILNYLVIYLGVEIRDYLTYEERDWAKEKFTTTSNFEPMMPSYGNNVFQSSYMSDKLLFSGTETSPQFGGYLEGAVISGILAVDKL